MDTAPLTVSLLATALHVEVLTILTADGIYLDIIRKAHFPDEILGLAGSSAVADRYDLDTIFLDHGRNRHYGLDLLVLGRMGIYDGMVQEVPTLIQAHCLASVAIAGIDRQGPLLPYRRGKQQLGKVLSENVDGLDVSLLLGLFQDFIGDGRIQKPLD